MAVVAQGRQAAERRRRNGEEGAGEARGLWPGSAAGGPASGPRGPAREAGKWARRDRWRRLIGGGDVSARRRTCPAAA